MRSLISRIHGLLKARKISCLELVAKYLNKIENLNNPLNAYVNLTADLRNSDDA